MDRQHRCRLALFFGFIQFALLIVGSLPAAGQFKVNIDGEIHTVIAARKLAEYMREADGDSAITFARAIVQGRIFAPAMGVDTVRAALDFTKTRFEDEIFLDEVVFLQPVRFAQSQFEDGISCRGARFDGGIDFSGSHFGGHANFKQTVLQQSANFANARFSKSAAFVDAAFQGAENSFAGARFEARTFCENAVFDGPTSFQDAAFGHVASFKETRWKAPVSFAGARFTENALFWQVHFADEALFNTAYFRREAAFNKAFFGGPASFRQAVFIRTAQFTQVRFEGVTTFAQGRFKRGADFTGSEFEQSVRLGGTFKGALNLQYAKAPLADLRSFIGVDQEAGGDSTTAATMRVYLQDAHFDQLLVNWSQLAGRLAVRDSAGSAALEPIYATLRHHFKVRGLHADADAAMVEWLDRKMQALPWTSGESLLLQFMRLSSNYGTEPWRLGSFAVGCVIVFTLFYFLGRTSLHSLGQSGAPTLGECIYFSLFVFTHLGSAHWRAVGRMRLLVAVEVILGWATWALLIAALVRYLLR